MNKEIEGYKNKWFGDGSGIYPNKPVMRKIVAYMNFYANTKFPLIKGFPLFWSVIVTVGFTLVSFLANLPLWTSLFGVFLTLLLIMFPVTYKIAEKVARKNEMWKWGSSRIQNVSKFINYENHPVMDKLAERCGNLSWGFKIDLFCILWIESSKMDNVVGDEIRNSLIAISSVLPKQGDDVKAVNEMLDGILVKLKEYKRSQALVDSYVNKNKEIEDGDLEAVTMRVRAALGTINNESTIMSDVAKELPSVHN